MPRKIPKLDRDLGAALLVAKNAYDLLTLASQEKASVPARYLQLTNGDLVDTGTRYVTLEELEALSGPVTVTRGEARPQDLRRPDYMTDAVLATLKEELPPTVLAARLANNNTDRLAEELGIDRRATWWWAKVNGLLVSQRGGLTSEQVAEKRRARRNGAPA